MALDVADLARRAADIGGEEAIASVSVRRELVVRSTPDGPAAPPRRTFDVFVRLMVRDGAGRIGVARCSSSTTDRQLELLAEQAHAQAAAALTDLRPWPRVAQGAGHEGFDELTSALDPLHAAGAARQAAASIGMTVGRDRSASWCSEDVEVAVAQSGGEVATDRRTGVQVRAEAVDADGRLVGFAQQSAPSILALATDELGRRATPLALPFDTGGHSNLLDPGDPVVLLPSALAPLLEALARVACTGHAHATGTSPYTGRAGLPVAAEAVTLIDAPRYLHTLARAIDVEGTPARPVALIDAGLGADVVDDTHSAVEGGREESTGHAATLGGDPAGAVARNLLLEGGVAEGVAAMLMPTDRAVVVGRIDHVITAGPGSTRFTAIGRAAYAVDRGTPTRLLGDVVLRGDLASAVAGILELTAEPELVATLDRLPERTMATCCPAVLTTGLDIFA